MSQLRLRTTILALVQRIEVSAAVVIIELRPHRLVALLDETAASSQPPDGAATVRLSHPIRLRRAGKEVRMVINQTGAFASDPSLVKALARARRFHDMLVNQQAGRFADLARRETLNRSYFSQILRLAYLAPDITAAILDGRQPEGLIATVLIGHSRLPLHWQEQRAVLGFA